MDRVIKPVGLFFAFGAIAIISVLMSGCNVEISEKQEEGEEGMSSGIFSFITGSAAVKQDFSESMSVEDETIMEISHSHGNITVKGWDRDEVKLEGRKSVKARDEETARMYAEQMRVEVKSEGGRIIVTTIRPERERKWKVNGITIDYELYAPERLSVVLNNSHGNVIVEGYTGKADLSTRHGNLHVAQIGDDMSINHEHGNIDVSQIAGNALVIKRHGNVDIGSIDGRLKLDHEHGAVTLSAIGKGAELKKRHGNLKATDVGGMLELDHQHGYSQLRVVGGDVKIKKQHGNIDVEAVNGNLSIQSEHSNLKIIDISGDVYLRGGHGNAHVENVT